MACKNKNQFVIFFAGILLFVAIIGSVVFIKTERNNSNWNITLRCTNVSNEGLLLTLRRNDKSGNTNIYMWEQFEIQKLSLKGWMVLEESRYLSEQFLDASGIQIKNEFSYTFEIDWKEECGILPMGIYRIAKEIGRVNSTQTHYATFVIVSWWKILLIVVLFLVLFIGMWVVMQYGVVKKVKNVSMIVVAVCIAMLGVYLGICCYFNHQTGREMLENFESWNIKSLGICYTRNKIYTFTESEEREFFCALETCEIGDEIKEPLIGGRHTYIVVDRYIGKNVKIEPNNTVISISNGIISESFFCEKGEALENFMLRFE